VEYEHIKKRAHDREDWRHWKPGPGPAWKGRALKKKRKTGNSARSNTTQLSQLVTDLVVTQFSTSSHRESK